MATDRTMSTTWKGTLMEGAGTIHAAGSGAFGALDVTWASRAEEPNGKTSPEELIAAAHSACFSMALSHGLAQAGTPAEQLDTSATVTFVPATGITKIALTVRGVVPGVDEAAFVEAAEGAKVGCPVSKALAVVPEITLDAAPCAVSDGRGFSLSSGFGLRARALPSDSHSGSYTCADLTSTVSRPAGRPSSSATRRWRRASSTRFP